jgi:hypothetical protein
VTVSVRTNCGKGVDVILIQSAIATLTLPLTVLALWAATLWSVSPPVNSEMAINRLLIMHQQSVFSWVSMVNHNRMRLTSSSCVGIAKKVESHRRTSWFR